MADPALDLPITHREVAQINDIGRSLLDYLDTGLQPPSSPEMLAGGELHLVTWYGG